MAVVNESTIGTAPAVGDGMPIATPQWQMGAWRAEPETNRIVGPEKTVRVEPKVMDVLVCFLERPNETLSQDYLMDVVWGEIIVEENALRRVISQLRKVFNDNPRQPKFIETIPKKGYRFIAPVAFQPYGAVLTTASDNVPAFEPRTVVQPIAASRNTYAWIVAVLVVLSIGSVVFSQIWSPEAIQPLPKRPLTTMRGVENQPKLSPDGQHIAFIWFGEDGNQSDVYVQSLSGDAPIQLTDSPYNEVSPVWAPDGNSLVFVKFAEEGCGLFEVSILGGTPHKRTDCPSFTNGAIDWSMDGNWFVIAGREERSQPFKLYLIDAETYELRLITDPPANALGDAKPIFSPDSKHIAFIRRETGALEDLFVVPTEGGAVRRLTFDAAQTAGHGWRANSASIILSSSRGGNYRLWEFPVRSGEPTWLASIGAYDPGMPTIAATGTHMAYEEWFFDFNIWRLDWPSDGDTSVQRQVIGSTQWEMHPQVSPDGQRVAFTSNRTGSNELWTSDTEGRQLMRLTNFNGSYVSNPRWSPDAQQLVFEVRHQAEADVYMMDAQGGALTQLTNFAGNEVAPSWSRDGAWIYFGSAQTGTWEVWRMPATGGTAEQITQAGGYAAQESVDGSTLYFAKNGRNGLWRMPLDASGEEEEVFDYLNRGDWGNWAVFEEGVYFIARSRNGPRFAFYDFSKEEADILAGPQMPVYDYKISFSVAPDASYILFTQTDQRETDLMLVEAMP